LTQELRIRSRWWYLLPIFFNIIGGVIAYFILRDDDPKKAKNCLWLGIVLIAIKIGLFIIFVSICTSIGSCADFHDEFMRGMGEFMEPQDMMQSPQQMQQMMRDPQMMQTMMQDPQFRQQMMDQMNTMMNDPEQRQQMMTMMMQNPEMMQSMMGNQQMMGMMDNMMMGNMPFNVYAPMTMPMIDGYYNGERVFFLHTEVSDKDMAGMMSMMVNFPTLHVSKLNDISSNEMAKVYVFTNGISGSGPYGGGPFMYQIDVFDSIPGQMGHSQFRVPHLVTWNDNSTPRILTSVDEILQAESNDELAIQKTDNVVNAPMIVWKSGGMEQRASMIQRMFESMPGVDGEVTNVDVDNYIVMLKMHSKNGMGMMGQGMMNP